MRGLIVRSTVGHMVTRGERIAIDVRIDGEDVSGIPGPSGVQS
jgi:hypothetical protein